MYITDTRIIIKTSSLFQKSAHKYASVPIKTIGCFYVKTAADSMLSTAATLKIRTRIGDEIDFNIDLSKKTADIYEVYSFLIARILPAHDIFGEEDPQETKKKFQNSEPEQQGILDWLGDNAVTMDPQEVQAKFQNFLHPAEKVKLAFNSGRDFIVFTSKRLLFVDVIGIAIKKIQYMSLLYEHVRMFSVETAAGQIFDRDGDLKLYTNLPNMPVFKIDLNRKCDIKGIQNFLTDVVCGRGAGMESQGEANSASMGGGDAWKNVPEWLQGEGNAGQIDAAEADMMYHSALQPHDLQSSRCNRERRCTIITLRPSRPASPCSCRPYILKTCRYKNKES